jgi:hypothetical protein
LYRQFIELSREIFYLFFANDKVYTKRYTYILGWILIYPVRGDIVVLIGDMPRGGVRCGKVRLGGVRCGLVRHGKAGFGLVRYGMAGHG